MLSTDEGALPRLLLEAQAERAALARENVQLRHRQHWLEARVQELEAGKALRKFEQETRQDDINERQRKSRENRQKRERLANARKNLAMGIYL